MWLIDLIRNLGGPNNFKAVTEDLWKTIHRQDEKIAHLEGKIDELGKENFLQQIEIQKLQHGEAECQKLILPLKEQNILLRTENTFLKRMK